MTVKDLKDKITELAQEHASVDEIDFDDFCNLELIEWKANKLINQSIILLFCDFLKGHSCIQI